MVVYLDWLGWGPGVYPADALPDYFSNAIEWPQFNPGAEAAHERLLEWLRLAMSDTDPDFLRMRRLMLGW